jgi:hypothetical protein
MSTHVPPPFQIPQTLLDDLYKIEPILDMAKEAVASGQGIIVRLLG